MPREIRADDELAGLLIEVVNHFDKEDTAVRERQIRTWRQLKLFWEGFQRVWYNEVAHDWRVFNDTDTEGEDTDQSYYDKPVNIFRAYLESIIAALSVVVPPIKCYPDDAENQLDLSTAKAGDKIAKLVFRHNDASLLWLHSLFIFCTEGMVACYNYPRSDKEYGTYEKKSYENIDEDHTITKCPECGYTINDQITSPDTQPIQDKLDQQIDLFAPDDEDVNLQNYAGEDICPACLAQIAPLVSQETLTVTRLVGITKEPKTHICLEAYGGLYVKVANYARKQPDTPYVIFSYETHYANAIDRYEHLQDKDWKQKISGSSGPKDPYEQYGRLSPQYNGEYPENVVTVRNAWLRPSAFNILQDKEKITKLKKRFPNGAKVVLVNDLFAEAVNCNLDDEWTLTYNPMSDFVHHDPLGLLLVSVQELTNDLLSLTIQTIEHGIGQTFADPGVLDFPAYRKMESIPGGVYEATPKSGKSISDAFHEVRTATLSPEVMPFATSVQSLGQMVSGALPSLFGGAIEGSETASQYSMSRAQALQRLQNVWKMFTVWWKQIFGKVIPMYIQETRDEGDQRDVERNKDGNFVNVFIRKAELEGKIGRVELEANENLPLTWSQKKDIVMQLLQAANPQILSVLGAPENLPVIREAIGLDDFFVPNEDYVSKAYDDIKLLLNSEPLPSPDPMIPEQASVEIDPDYENPEVTFEIIRKWVISDAGRQAKTDNEAGYKNVLLYGKQLKMLMQQQMMAQQQPQGAAPAEKPNPNETQEAPIQGEENVTVQ